MQGKILSIQIGPLSHAEFSLNDGKLSLQKFTQSKSDIRHDIEYRHILKASFDDDKCVLTVAYLTKKKKSLHLIVVEGQVDQSQADHAAEWCESVMKAVYDAFGIKRSRRFMIFVNPYGGRKKAVTIFQKKVEPTLKAAGCSFEVHFTTHQGQAQTMCQTLSLDFDAVITVSGDGVVHEILNGFAQHEDPISAFSVPVAPIPTGSGNGLCLNLLGREEGLDVLAATLNAIKGQAMKVDILAFTQGGKRTISFMSQALGLMADLDVGTDNLRWMGESRFLYGLLRGILTKKKSPIQLSYKLAESDKYKMASDVANRHQTLTGEPISPSPLSASTQYSFEDISRERYEENEEGWTIFPHPIIYLYAGKGPYVGRDFMAFPVSVPDDGLIDLTVMTDEPTRGDLFASMDGAHEGKTYWHPKVHYVKAHKYRVKPLQKDGHLSVDGEPFPFEEFEVEVYKSPATLLSCYGRYAAKFQPRVPPLSA